MRRDLYLSLGFIIAVAVLSLAGTLAAGHHIVRGLDLRGGVSVVLQPQGTATNATLQEAVNIIENRVSGLNIADSNVERQGHDVVISLPGIKDPQQALGILGSTATLYFRPVYCYFPNYAAPGKASSTTTTSRPTVNTTRPSTSTTPKAAGQEPASLTAYHSANPAPTSTTTTTTVPPTGISQATCSATNASGIPSTPVGRDTANQNVLLPSRDKTLRYVLGPADMSGSAIHDASAILNTSTGQYEVQVTFTTSGGNKFDQIAAQRYACYQQSPSNPPPCALEAADLDGEVISAPAIEASSFNGTAVISGSTSNPFTSGQANNLAIELKYGSLPVRFVPQSIQTVSATIGKDTLRAGVLAGIGGIIAVMLYMLFYYRALAFIVFFGLMIGGAILYSILALLSQGGHIALTLAGVTGLIVSVGITVDSYIVYFERLKDDVRGGRTVRQSVERSFNRAFRTVVIADGVSLLAAAILYFFTVGAVRNFALTLGLATALDIFTAFFYIRPAVILAGRHRSIVDNRFLGISRGLGARAAISEA
jgi:preprotein translocase subunit SecD